MLAITLSDLRYRRRQFLIAVIGAGLVFALALLLSGIVAGFHNEVRRTLATFGADRWVVPTHASGPFTAVSAVPAATFQAVAHAKGVTAATPLIVALQTATVGDKPVRAMMIGSVPGSFGQATPRRGRPVGRAGEAVVDGLTGLKLGEQFKLNGFTFTVVGLTHGLSVLGAAAAVWITLKDAQTIVFGGQNLITSVVTRGVPASLPPTMRAMTMQEVTTDTLNPMRSAMDSINNTRWFMWMVAVIIVAALVYVSALQRLRDFAVMKAVGASSARLFGGVTFQSVIITGLAATFAVSVAGLLKPIYTLPVEIPAAGYLSLPVVAMGVGVGAALVALRQAIKVDPSLAFGAST